MDEKAKLTSKTINQRSIPRNDQVINRRIEIKYRFYYFYSCTIIFLLFAGYFLTTAELLPYDPEDIDFDNMLSAPMTADHLLGTDYLGRDTLSRLIVGIEAYLLPSIFAASIAISFSIIASAISLFSNKRLTRTLHVINESLIAMPRLIFILLIITIFEPTIFYIMLVIGISNIPSVSQLLLARIDQLKERNFIESAISSGISFKNLVLKHVLWANCRTILFSQSALIIGEAILLEASLSYLGFGVQEPDPSWGNMVQSGSNYLLQGDIWPSTIPALAIMAVISAFYLLSYTITQTIGKN